MPTTLHSLPAEMLSEVASYLELRDVANLRLVSKKCENAAATAYLKTLASKPLYPRYDSLKGFFDMLEEFPGVVHHTEEITVVHDTVRVHEHDSEYGWRLVEQDYKVARTDEDDKLIDHIKATHKADVLETCKFIHSCGYRNMLADVMATFPNLRKINVRALHEGEHVPGWIDLKVFKHLSYWQPGMDFKDALYGPYLYDEENNRITWYRDEYGETILEPDAGTQVTFVEDLKAAYAASGTKAPFPEYKTPPVELPCAYSTYIPTIQY